MFYNEALLKLKNGEAMCRPSWGGAWIRYQGPQMHPADGNYQGTVLFYDGDVTGTNRIYDPSTEDLEADDWMVHGSPDEAVSPVPEGETMPGGQDLSKQNVSEGVVEDGEPKFVESGEPVTVDRTDDQVHDDKDDIHPLTDDFQKFEDDGGSVKKGRSTKK